MPENKRQHYVPKHILKRFASDSEGKRIGLVHIPTLKVIRGASLREQCYRDYFYGTDLQIEHALSQLESSQSRLIEKVAVEEQLDPFDTARVALMFSLQRSRTLRAETEISGMVEAFLKLAMHGKVPEKALRNVRIGLKHGSGLNISTAMLMGPLLYDLRQMLVVNRSSTPFVLSDNPVVTSNWFCRARYPERHSTSISLSGLQMLMPITPFLAILLIDGGVYSTEAVNNKIIIRRSKVVQYLNRLQWLGALSSVYFPPTLADYDLEELKQIERAKTKLFQFERLDRVGQTNAYRATKKGEYEGPSPGVTSEVIRMNSQPLPEDIRFPGLRIRQKPHFYDDGSMASPQRDPVWCEIIRNFGEAVSSGKLTYEQLNDFIERHPLEPHIGLWRRRSAMRASRSRKHQTAPNIV